METGRSKDMSINIVFATFCHTVFQNRCTSLHTSNSIQVPIPPLLTNPRSYKSLKCDFLRGKKKQKHIHWFLFILLRLLISKCICTNYWPFVLSCFAMPFAHFSVFMAYRNLTLSVLIFGHICYNFFWHVEVFYFDVTLPFHF